jgi:opacity protein-like surface antigen
MHRGLIGLEGEASTQAITTTAQLTTSTAADISARTDQTFFARGRARLGYLIYPQVLIFTAVGLSLAQTKYADQLTTQTLPHPEMNSQKINAGVNFGFGTEYAFNHKTFVRLDYLHDAFRDRDANGLITPQENLNHRSILTTNIFRGGVSYKF